MKKTKQGFTLIELLVVIAIIGLLSTLSIVALNQARARSRDARRIADIKQIQTALEMYYNDNNAYPAAVTPGGIIGSSTNPYMAIVPAAPTPFDNASGSTACSTANTYTYAPVTWNSATNASYTLTYCLGSVTGGVKAGLNTATPSGITSQAMQ